MRFMSFFGFAAVRYVFFLVELEIESFVMFMLGKKVFVKSCAQLHLCRKNQSLRQTEQLSMHIFFARLFVCGLLLLSCCTVVVLDTFGHFSCLHFVCELTGYSTANGAICGAAGERGVAVSNIESKTWPSKSNIPIAFTRKMLSDGLLFMCVTQAVAEQAGPSAEGAFTRVVSIVSSRLVDVDCHRA